MGVIFHYFLVLIFNVPTITCVCPVFSWYYHPPTLTDAPYQNVSTGRFPAGNGSEGAGGLGLAALPDTIIHCTRERPVLCLLLMLGTLWMGYTLYQFKRR